MHIPFPFISIHACSSFIPHEFISFFIHYTFSHYSLLIPSHILTKLIDTLTLSRSFLYHARHSSPLLYYPRPGAVQLGLLGSVRAAFIQVHDEEGVGSCDDGVGSPCHNVHLCWYRGFESHASPPSRRHHPCPYPQRRCRWRLCLRELPRRKGVPWAVKDLVLVTGLVLPMMASGLEDLGVFVSGFGLVMKPKPKQEDKKK